MENKECWVCNGTEPKSFTRKCKKHDVCDSCGKNRSEIDGVPWGTTTGFICDSCQQEKWKRRIEAFTDEDFEESDFLYRDDIKCPYCGHEYQPDDLHEDTDNECCPHCNSTFEVEVEWTANFTISKPKQKST